MQVPLSVKAISLAACAFLLTLPFTRAPARGAERIGVRVLNVTQIHPNAAMGNSDYMGIYGDVLMRRRGLIIIKDRGHPETFIEVTTRRLGAADRRHLRKQCALTACSEIVLGRMAGGRLEAVRLYTFRTSDRADESPASAIVAAPDHTIPPARCHDLMHCSRREG